MISTRAIDGLDELTGLHIAYENYNVSKSLVFMICETPRQIISITEKG